MIISTTTLLLLINASRSPKTPLKSDFYLNNLAMSRCVEMPDFSHDLYYSDYSKRIEKKYKFTGENLAVGFNTASSTVNAWKNSKTHKDIMLSKKYKHIGIAVCEKAPKVYLTVSLYGGN